MVYSRMVARLCVLHRRVLALLDGDPEHSGRQVLQAGRLAVEGSTERLVHRRVSDHLLGVGEEKDFEVVLDGVADQDPSLEEVGHFLLDNFEVDTCNKSYQ